MKTKTATLLMEVGAEYSKRRLHGGKYFQELLCNLDYVPESALNLLQMSHDSVDFFSKMQKTLIYALRNEAQISKRVQLLMSSTGGWEVTALTWVLEIGDINRFSSIGQMVSYCGLCSAQKESAGKEIRGPISKKRNKHLQTVLVEAAKLAPQWNPQLAEIHERELKRGTVTGQHLRWHESWLRTYKQLINKKDFCSKGGSKGSCLNELLLAAWFSYRSFRPGTVRTLR